MNGKRGIISSANSQEIPDLEAPIMPKCRGPMSIIRADFKELCENDPCRAALLNHLLYWIAHKAKGQEPEKIRSGEVHWYGTAEEIRAGLVNSWSINKVRKEIKALVERGLIGQRRNPVKRWDQTRHYFFGEEQGKALKAYCAQYGINLLELGLPTDMLHLLELVNAFDTSGKCIQQNCEMDLPNMADASTKSGNAIPENSPKKTTKKESSASSQDVADATTPSQSSLSETTAFENTDQRQQGAAPPTPQVSQPWGKPPSSSIEVQSQGKPEMPPDDMPWGPEKMVRVTECLRFCCNEQGAWFSTQPTGKTQKSQRDRQLASAKKIFAEIPTLTQDEYIAAYSEQNNEWWNQKGSLTVEHMAANTPRKVMRTVELLEIVRTRSNHLKLRPSSQASLGATPPQPVRKTTILTREQLKAMPVGDEWR